MLSHFIGLCISYVIREAYHVLYSPTPPSCLLNPNCERLTIHHIVPYFFLVRIYLFVFTLFYCFAIHESEQNCVTKIIVELISTEYHLW